ncbi:MULTISPECIES: FAD-dependent oxidoreductase [unclassified Francisella]|uniref:FAD-dependent oxidoreductase n=1 Tax=unclassified Francisella TaxID=2610885 RepID=UPI002E3385E6|nr:MULTISPECIES: FAD-dependent oxidoreductase [unclassified Francisella]MED7819862.1 FAD-dependent oxidoreductase [Francisella sp. 19S2-4]MED7830674.1 FAD-dependent oxidoreductase [Francisella sp. 19S2-10]
MNKVAIIGSGVMGRVLAITLAKTYPELQLDIYDKSSSYKHSCSYCAGGMLSPLSELITCEKHAYEIGHNSYELWNNINCFINEHLNIINMFVKEANTYVIVHNQDRYELDLAIRNINLRVGKLSKTLHQKAQEDFEICDKQNVLFKEQGICLSNSINDNVIKLNEALVNVPEFFKLSDQFFKEYKNIKTLELSKEDFYANEFDEGYQQIFDCTGFINNQLNNLYGSRGEAIVVKANNIKLNSVIKLLHPRHCIYLIPRGNGFFYIGATSIESQDYSDISVQGVLELLSSLMIIDKRFAEARVIKTLTNVRPVSSDDIPILKSGGKTTYLNGLSRHGYLFAPALANKVIQRINNF